MAQIIQEEKGEKGGKKRPKKHAPNIDMTPMVDLMCLLITFFMLTTAFSKPKVMEIVLPEKKQDTTKTKSPQVAANRTLNIILCENDIIYWYIGMADPNKPPLPTLTKTDYSKDGIRKVILERNKEVFKKIAEIEDKVKSGKLKVDEEIDALIKECNDEWRQDTLKNANKKDMRDKLKALKADKAAKKLSDNDYIQEYLNYKTKKIKADDQIGPVVLIKCENKIKYRNFVDIIDEMAIANIARYAVVDINPVEQKLIDAAKGIAPLEFDTKSTKK